MAGPLAAICLLIASFLLAWFVAPAFAAVLLGYYILTTAYSLRLKRVVMLDVIVLATLYTTRILAGAAAVRVPPSFWLLAFSMFLFLSLAMIKRYTELVSAMKRGRNRRRLAAKRMLYCVNHSIGLSPKLLSHASSSSLNPLSIAISF